MSLNLPAKKSRVFKTYNPLTDFKSITNSKKLKDFMKKNINIEDYDFDITIVPNRTKVYQGVNYVFDYSKSKEEYVKEFYRRRHSKEFYVSSKASASIYGIDIDKSNIIYTTIPDNNDIKKSTKNYKYVYPLYYIPGPRGTNIKYKLKKDLYLLNIGDPKIIKLLWNIIEKLEYSEKDDDDETDRSSLKDLLVVTCAEAGRESPIKTIMPDGRIKKTWGERKVMPTKCVRFSKYETDKKLVGFFQDKLAPYLKQNLNIHIDGWIYYKTEGDDFHDEIMLLSNKHLDFHSTHEIKPTKYNDIPTLEEIKARVRDGEKANIIYIPTIDEYRVLMADRRKDNNIKLKPKNVLINSTSLQPYKAQ
jgi:hypothetical protein